MICPKCKESTEPGEDSNFIIDKQRVCSDCYYSELSDLIELDPIVPSPRET